MGAGGVLEDISDGDAKNAAKYVWKEKERKEKYRRGMKHQYTKENTNNVI